MHSSTLALDEPRSVDAPPTLADRSAEDRYRSLFEHAIEGVFQTTVDGKYVAANPALARMYGFDSPADLLRNFHDIARQLYVQPRRREQFRRLIERDGYVANFESEVRRHDNATIWISENARTVRDAEGRILGYEGTVVDISERKRHEEELKQLNEQLVAAARYSGMAEIATGVLHNVGNVLNSVNVAATVVGERVRGSSSTQLRRVVDLLAKHTDDLGDFITRDRRGQQVPQFLRLLADQLEAEQANILTELDDLTKNIDHVKTIVSMQQSYASMTGLTEPIQLADLMSDALRLNATSLERHHITLVQEFEELPDIHCEKQKLLQIVVNLIKNAKDALKASNVAEPQLALRVYQHGPEGVRLEVADNGSGIAPENLTRIFSQGFTTKADGHGFGLHCSANAAREMGGNLTVESAGLGHGARFIIDLPLRTTHAELVEATS